jgi:hypothetical protein
MKKYHHVTVGKMKSGDRARTIPFGSSIKAIVVYPKGSRKGKTRAKKGKGKSRIISLRFSPQAFTLAQARAWAKSHGYRVISTAKAGTTAKRTLKKKAKKKVARRHKTRRKITA